MKILRVVLSLVTVIGLVLAGAAQAKEPGGGMGNAMGMSVGGTRGGQTNSM